jgi:hypothetical protein
LGAGGSGVGGGDTCYDGPGSDPSLPLCELHPDDAVEIEAEEVPCGVTPWDVVDWISLGISFNDFIQDPTLENLGWLILDALGAALPVLPALGTVQNAGELIDSANDVLKTKSIFISTPSGSVIPIPKGYEAFVAESGEGIVFKPSNRNSLPNPRNGNSIRVMDPGADPRYPNGYIRYYNQHGQPLDTSGMPGSQATSHHCLGGEISLPGFINFVKDRM